MSAPTEPLRTRPDTPASRREPHLAALTRPASAGPWLWAALGAVAVACTVDLWLLPTPAYLGRVSTQLFTPVAWLVVAATFVHSRSRRADVVLAAVLALLMLPLVALHGPTLTGLVVAAGMEEGAYRVAAPVALFTLTRALGRSPAQAAAVAVAGSTVLFVLLPGHLAQLGDDPALVVAGLAGAHLVLLWVVWRAGLVLAATLGHAALNGWMFAAVAEGPRTLTRTVVTVTLVGGAALAVAARTRAVESATATAAAETDAADTVLLRPPGAVVPIVDRAPKAAHAPQPSGEGDRLRPAG